MAAPGRVARMGQAIVTAWQDLVAVGRVLLLARSALRYGLLLADMYRGGGTVVRVPPGGCDIVALIQPDGDVVCWVDPAVMRRDAAARGALLQAYALALRERLLAPDPALAACLPGGLRMLRRGPVLVWLGLQAAGAPGGSWDWGGVWRLVLFQAGSLAVAVALHRGLPWLVRVALRRGALHRLVGW